MSMERGGFGNVAPRKFVSRTEFVGAGSLAAGVRETDRWAGAAATAARAGARASADLLSMACLSSTATAGLFDMKLLKKHHHLQLEHAGKTWSVLREPSSGRVGSACCGATVWAFGCLETGAFAGSVRAWEQHVRT